MKRILIFVAKVIFLLGVWEGLYLLVKNHIPFDGPWQVIQELHNIIRSGDCREAILITTTEIAAGFILALGVSLLLGFICAKLGFVKETVGFVIRFTGYIPMISFTILLVIWIPDGFLAFWVSLFLALPILFSHITQAFGAKPFDYDELSVGCKLGVNACWKSSVIAQLIGPLGEYVTIGETLKNYKEQGDVAGIFAMTVVLIVLSLLFEFLVMLVVNHIGKTKRRDSVLELLEERNDM